MWEEPDGRQLVAYLEKASIYRTGGNGASRIGGGPEATANSMRRTATRPAAVAAFAVDSRQNDTARPAATTGRATIRPGERAGDEYVRLGEAASLRCIMESISGE
ncbi:hypothetical protein MAFF211271_25750 [Ralstonia syzygii subsp. indonesiensis]|nr:hypothetical protein MAFF211271_25750 [Ralstonia pseudosolanacearum]